MKRRARTSTLARKLEGYGETAGGIAAAGALLLVVALNAWVAVRAARAQPPNWSLAVVAGAVAVALSAGIIAVASARSRRR